MPMTMESRVRDELQRERKRLDSLRADPSMLKPELRHCHDEIVGRLEETFERALDAIERIGEPGTEGRTDACDAFLDAWSELQSRVRLVCAEQPFQPRARPRNRV